MNKLTNAIMVVSILMAVIFISSNANSQTIADVVLTLDVSGSIDESEITQEVNGLISCINLIPDNGTVGIGIVVYGETAATALGITTLTPATLPTIQSTLTSLISPGAADGVNNDPARLVNTTDTNIEAGINQARGLLNATPTEQDFIFLVGDGDSSVGTTQNACDAAAADGIIICALSVGAPEGGFEELNNCATATGGQAAEGTFANFEALCEECLGSFLIGTCISPTVFTDPGLCTAAVDCSSIATFTNLFNDVITGISFSCVPASPYPVGNTVVTVTASKEGFSSATVVCSVTVIDNELPTIDCFDRIVECDGAGNTEDLEQWLDENVATADDNCAVANVTIVDQEFVEDCGATGIHTVTFVVTDVNGNVSVPCTATLTIVDTIAPEIQCNAPATILPLDPQEDETGEGITFTATATDACCLEDVTILTSRCYQVKQNGKIIDKSESCVVEINDDEITIYNTGGVDTIIEWDVYAVDCCGNETFLTCSVHVINPGQN